MRSTTLLRTVRTTPRRFVRSWGRPRQSQQGRGGELIRHQPARADAPSVFSPFKELEDMMANPFALASPFMRSSLLSPFSSPFFQPSAEMQNWMRSSPTMAMDLNEGENEYSLTVDVPGVPKENIKVNIDADTNSLTVSAERKMERESKPQQQEVGQEGKEEEGKEVQQMTEHWSEKAYGSFTRSVELPADADLDNVEASYKDGVLSLRVPKKPQAEGGRKRTIDIK